MLLNSKLDGGLVVKMALEGLCFGLGSRVLVLGVYRGRHNDSEVARAG